MDSLRSNLSLPRLYRDSHERGAAVLEAALAVLFIAILTIAAVSNFGDTVERSLRKSRDEFHRAGGGLGKTDPTPTPLPLGKP